MVQRRVATVGDGCHLKRSAFGGRQRADRRGSNIEAAVTRIGLAQTRRARATRLSAREMALAVAGAVVRCDLDPVGEQGVPRAIDLRRELFVAQAWTFLEAELAAKTRVLDHQHDAVRIRLFDGKLVLPGSVHGPNPYVSYPDGSIHHAPFGTKSRCGLRPLSGAACVPSDAASPPGFAPLA